MKKIVIILLLTVFSAIVSCSKYLDVSDEVAEGLQDLDQIFNNVNYTKRYYANIFTGIPDYSSIISANGFGNPWTAMSDEVITTYGNVRLYATADKNEESVKFHRWGYCFDMIRQANIFLANVKPILPSGSQANELTIQEVNDMKANARFMRAFYHYLLFEQYGSFPLVKDRIFKSNDDLDLPRAPLDEIINYIDSELLAVASELKQAPIQDEQYRAWPTKGIALAVRAKLWMYAASPLFNGGFSEALSVMTPAGPNGELVRMYPDYTFTKWEKAKAAMKDFIDYAEAGNYQLYSTGDPMEDVYKLFQEYNNEIIWATSNNNWGGLDGDAFDRRTTPRSEQNGIGCTGIFQELVDDFYMNDGLPISNTDFLPASPLYSETGFTNVDGEPVFNMWVNREPRFYNTVFYEGRKWHITNNVIEFHLGSPNDKSGQHTLTGYMLYKRYNRKISKKSPGVSSKFRPSIIFRLADFYLLYAEVLNEVDPTDTNILVYLNKVRSRAGLPNLETLNPAVVGNQDLLRQAIRRERRIELATEGQRYFDVRRWMIADKPSGNQNKDLHGMDMAKARPDFFTRTKVKRYVFKRKMYLYPVPYSEIQKSKGKMVQNPGWGN